MRHHGSICDTTRMAGTVGYVFRYQEAGHIHRYRLEWCSKPEEIEGTIPGSSKPNFPFEIFRSRLIEKFGAFTGQ